MPLSKEKRQKQLAILQTNLLQAFKQEIAFCQETLNNISQQEHSLLTGDTEYRMQLQQEIKKIEKERKKWKKERLDIIKQMTQLAPLDSRGAPLEKMVDPLEENGWEILALYQKYQALVQKIKIQQTRITSLFQVIRRDGPIDLSAEGFHAKAVYPETNKKKPLLITIDYPEEPF